MTGEDYEAAKPYDTTFGTVTGEQWLHVEECLSPHEACICASIRHAERRVADAIAQRITEYGAGLTARATRDVAITCAGLATAGGLR